MANQQQTLTCSKTILYGQCGNLNNSWSRARLFAKNQGADSVSLIISPKNPEPDSDSGIKFKTLEDYMPNSLIEAQGGVLKKKGQALIIESCDETVIVMENRETGLVVAVRGGVEQLMNIKNPCMPLGVIERSLPSIGLSFGIMFNAYITGGICAEHYPNDKPNYAQAFVECYGDQVLCAGSKNKLDPRAVITAILQKRGFLEKNIFQDNLCTAETPWLSSQVTGKPGVNWTLVVKK